MNRSVCLGIFVAAIAACSAARGGGTGIIDDDDAPEASVDDVTAADAPAGDKQTVDAPAPDAPASDGTAPEDTGAVDARPDDVAAVDNGPEDTGAVDTGPAGDTGRGCARDSECTGSTFCNASGVCAPLVCTPSRATCVSMTLLRTCDARGAAFTETECSGGCVGNVCTGGMTGCASPRAMCGAACTDTQTDAANCGGCGRACAAGQACVTGVCAAGPGCTSPAVRCGATCVDVSSDTLNCGACGRSCLAGQVCAARACTTSCTFPLVSCGGTCVNTQTSLANCGRCGNPCASTQTCSAGACAGGVTCAAPLTACAGGCADTRSDAANCGACGRACGAGQSCGAGACVASPTGAAFQITSLGTAGCRTAEHASVTGDDHGGIAVGTSALFYTGDSSTGRFDLDALTGTAVGVIHDSLASNLRTGTAYVFGTSAAVALGAGGTATYLIELDQTTGRLTTRTVALSAPVVLSSSGTGIFSGWDRIAVATSGRVYNIDLPSGRVTDAGAMVFPTHQGCETWAFWGVAEFFGGRLYLDYVEGSTRIARVRVPDAVVTTVGAFTNLSDMCSFTVSPARSRWYFHHEGTSQFAAGLDENIGYCPAVISAGGATTCDPSLAACSGSCVDLTSDASNCGACGRACTASQTCRAGVCSTVTGGMNYVAGAPPSSVTFVDACAAPGATTVLAAADDEATTVPLGFAFPFWGLPLAATALVNFNSNGIISLDGLSNASRFPAIPSTAAPNGIVAAYWGDNYNRGGQCVATVGAAPDRRRVFEWNDTVHCCTVDPAVHLTYEIVLNESGPIDLLYSRMDGALSRTVGVENQTGARAVSGCLGTTGYACTPTAATRVRFTPSP